MQEYPNPAVGQLIKCNANHFTNLNSDKPAIRIRYSTDEHDWVALNPEEKSGLIVFLENPDDLNDAIESIEITETGERVAFAKRSNSV